MHTWEMGVKTATRPRWTAPPLWPEPPAGWMPPPNWRPDPAWAPAPDGWAFLRCAETAAGLAVEPAHRSADLDRRIRPYIATLTTPAARFGAFLDEIRGLGDAAPATHSPTRVRLLRSISSAAEVLTRAAQRDAPAPFVFFACVQDAVTAAATLAAEAPAAVVGAPFAQVQEAQEKGQELFDRTVARIMVVFNRAVADIGANRATASAARRALRELDEVKRLVEMAGARKSMPIGDLLHIIDALDGCGRRAAATLGIRY